MQVETGRALQRQAGVGVGALSRAREPNAERIGDSVLVGGDDKRHLRCGQEQPNRLKSLDDRLGQAPVEVVDKEPRWVRCPKDRDIAAEMAFAARLTPLLYEKLRGNPRRIKRFLNDLRVRQSVVGHRGIELELDVVAKMMVLEKLLRDEFKTVVDWMAKGELREQIRALEKLPTAPTPTRTRLPRARHRQPSSAGARAQRPSLPRRYSRNRDSAMICCAGRNVAGFEPRVSAVQGPNVTAPAVRRRLA